MPDDSTDEPAGDDAEGTRTGDRSDGGRANDRDDGQPTVSIGSEGFRPDEDGAAGREGDSRDDATAPGSAVDQQGAEFGWRGWVLVGVLVVSLVVLPVLVSLRPVRVIGFRATYLLLPTVPAFVLAVTAVWAAVRSRQG